MLRWVPDMWFGRPCVRTATMAIIPTPALLMAITVHNGSSVVCLSALVPGTTATTDPVFIAPAFTRIHGMDAAGMDAGGMDVAGTGMAFIAALVTVTTAADTRIALRLADSGVVTMGGGNFFSACWQGCAAQ